MNRLRRSQRPLLLVDLLILDPTQRSSAVESVAGNGRGAQLSVAETEATHWAHLMNPVNCSSNL